jgi:hypothetical protein
VKTATYQNPDNLPAKKLRVIATHADGTVDLGSDEKTVVIAKCRVATTPTVGQCTIDPEPQPEKSPAKSAKEPKQ